MDQCSIGAFRGGNRGHLYHFWPEFKKAPAKAHKFYPKAIIEVKNDCIILKDPDNQAATARKRPNILSVDGRPVSGRLSERRLQHRHSDPKR